MRDKFRDIGEVKFAEIRGLDTGVVRFSKDREAEVAISEFFESILNKNTLRPNFLISELMDGSRIDGRVVEIDFF